MLKKILCCVIVVIILIACTKLKDNSPAPIQSNLSLLTAKSWKFSAESHGDTNTWRNDTCNTDAKFIFNANYTYTYIGCDSSDAYLDSTSGHWAFLNSNQTVIVFHPNTTKADTFQIGSITSSVLVVLQYKYGVEYSETFIGL